MESTVIGRVSVKVWPDTSGFREKAKKDLGSAIRGLAVKIPVEPDSTGAVEELDAIREELQRRAGDITINVDLDKSALDRIRQDLNNTLGGLDKEHPLKLNTDDALKDLGKVNDDLKGLDDDLRNVGKNDDFKSMGDDLRKIDDSTRDIHDNMDGVSKDVADQSAELSKSTSAFDELSKSTDDMVKSIDEAGQGIDDLSSQLDKIDRKVKIDIEIANETPTEREIDKLKTKLSDLRAKIDIQLPDDERLKVESEIDGIKAKINLLQGWIKVGIDPVSEAKLKTEIDTLTAELKGKQATVDLGMDEAQYRNTLRDIKDVQDKLDKAAKKRKAEIDADLNDHLGVAVKLARLARDRVVNYLPTVSKAAALKTEAVLKSLSGTTGVTKSLSSITDAIEEMFNDAPKLGVIATGIGGIVTEAGGAATNILSLAHSLALVAPAGLALPGIFGGIGVSLITIGAAFSGLKKTMPGIYKDFSKLKQTIATDFWAKAGGALKELMPILETSFGGLATALGDLFGTVAKSVIPDLPEMFKNTAKAAQDLAGYAKPIGGIISTLGRTGSQYLPVLANAIGGVATQFNDWLKKVSKDGQLTDWIDAGISGLKDLGSIASGAFGILSGLVSAADKADGSTLSTFATTLHNISDVINSPGFQKDITGFFKGLEDGLDNINSQAGDGLKGMFQAIARNAKNTLPKIGTAFGSALDDATRIINNSTLLKAWDGLWSDLGGAFKKIKPDMKGIGDGLGTIIDLGGKVASSGISALGGILGAIGGGLKDAKPGLHDFAINIGKFLTSFTNAVKGGLKDFVGKLGPLGEDLSKVDWKKLGSALGEIASAGFTAAGRILQGLTDAITQAVRNGSIEDYAQGLKDIAWAINQISGDSIPVGVGSFFGIDWGKTAGNLQLFTGPLSTLIGEIHQLATGNDVNSVVQIIGNFIDLFGGLSTDIIDAFNGSPHWLAGVGQAIVQSLIDGFNTVKASVKQWLVDLTLDILQWKGPPAKDATLLTAAGATIIRSLINGFSSERVAVANWLKVLTKQIPGWIASPGKLLYSVGSSIVSGLVNGLHSITSRVSNAVKDLKVSITNKWGDASSLLRAPGEKIASSLRNGMSALGSSVSREASNLKSDVTHQFRSVGGLLYNAGSSIASGFRNGIRSMAGAVGAAAWNNLVIGAWDGVKGAGSVLYGAGQSIVSGFINGLESMFNNVRSSLSYLTSLLPSWKGPASTDATILSNAGQLVIQGFIDGLESQYDAVESSLKKLTKIVAGTSVPPISVKNSTVPADSAFAANSLSDGGNSDANARVLIKQTNYYPQAQNTSEATNDALATAALFGLT